MATLFFSYSHQDETLRDRLKVHLSLLKRWRHHTKNAAARVCGGRSFDGRGLAVCVAINGKSYELAPSEHCAVEPI